MITHIFSKEDVIKHGRNTIIIPKNSSFLIKKEGDFFRRVSKETLENEIWFYKTISKYRLNQIQDITPKLFSHTKKNEIKLEYIKNSNSLFEYYKKTGKFPSHIPKKIAINLANIHSSTNSSLKKHLRDPEHNPFIPKFKKITPEFAAHNSEPVIELIKWLQKDPDYDKMLNLEKKTLQCIIHGDLKFDNILIQNTSNSKSKLYFIDWELSGWGNPNVDLAAVIANFLMMWIDSFPMYEIKNFEKMIQNAKIPFSEITDSIKIFWDCYFTNVNKELSSNGLKKKEIINYVGLIFVQYAYSEVYNFHDLTPRSFLLLMLAKTFLSTPNNAAEILTL